MFILKNGDVCLIKSAVDQSTLCVVVFDCKKKAKHYPCDSRKFNIFVVKGLGTEMVCPCSDVIKQCFLLPYKSRYLCFPLCHNMQQFPKC